VNDYRANVERQSREQKSVGGMIAIIVYTLAGLFVLGGLLAAYGAYTISRQMHQQSVTLTDLDSRYSAETQALTAQLKASNDSLTEALTQAQAQLKRQQELLAREQEQLTRQQDVSNKLVTANDAITAALRQERQQRAAETATLRAHVRTLEEQRYSTANRP
jgi:chromosome segregation ATPase